MAVENNNNVGRQNFAGPARVNDALERADARNNNLNGGAGNIVPFAAKLLGNVAGATGLGLGPAGQLLGGNLGGEQLDQVQLLELQRQMQEESQIFNTLSNVSKTEHETRMAAVRNMKA